MPGIRLVAQSRWYATSPIPASDQPDYINGMVRLDALATPDPVAILAGLHAIEARAGRVRGEINAPRVLDLDLVAVDGLVRDTPPVLPHPRAHQRAFVLCPLRDVAPDWVHPTLGRTAEQLLAELPPQGIRSL